LLLAFVAANCAPRTLDTDQLERRLGRQLSERLGISGIEATCPKGIEVRTRATFVCTARAAGENVGLRIVVTQLDDDGHVSWEIAGAAG
jgi:uncharacterized protein DUF4333